jgi:hypothetical protein
MTTNDFFKNNKNVVFGAFAIAIVVIICKKINDDAKKAKQQIQTSNQDVNLATVQPVQQNTNWFSSLFN